MTVVELAIATFVGFALGFLLTSILRNERQRKPYLVRSEKRGPLARFKYAHQARFFGQDMAEKEPGVRIWIDGPYYFCLLEEASAAHVAASSMTVGSDQ